MKRFLAGLVGLSLLLGGIVLLVRSPQQENRPPSNFEPRFYPETGHSVSGDFLRRYLQAENPELIYGLPITEPFYSKEAQRIVQYFENTRFEFYPENPPELRVRVTPLGQIFLHQQPATELEIPYPLGRCQSFPETGFSVCYDFLDFFERNGGVRIFGYPISEVVLQDGLIVQYFQLLRIEWGGAGSAASPVRVSPLGRRYFSLVQEDQRLLAALSAENNAPQLIRSIRVRAFPLKPVASLIETQSIYVIVQDQNERPVADAQVSVRIFLPDGLEAYPPGPRLSDASGIARFDFPYQSTQPGIAVVRVHALYGDLQASSETSFRIWK